ncbi:MAG TPA: thymidylate kinase [Patescibacteria group bacterium]|nr:thymidylate kinase [Patescibacteria group bacterium]
MAGKLIIIEAGDGSGKATQTARLRERLAREGYPVRQVEYPNYQSPSSALIKMYLGGEFGSDPGAVNPYAASAFYAVDRYASFKKDWEEFYRRGGIVIADRYTTSNMVHQAVKIEDPMAKESFLEWLEDFEFAKCGLPAPDGVIFLDVPPDFTRALIEKRSRETTANQDIHEQNQDYLVACHRNALLVARKYHWFRVACVAENRLRSIDDIHEEVYELVRQMLAGIPACDGGGTGKDGPLIDK